MSTDARADGSGDDGLTPALTDEQLRPALELAFAVAVAGQRLKPPITPPQPLKRFLNFQKLPKSALATVRKVVESDSVFRERIAKVATNELATELGAVWLTQAEGWEERVTKLLALADEESERDDIERGDRSSQRRAALAEAAATKTRAELAALHADLDREKSRRADAEARANELTKAAAAHAEARETQRSGELRARERLITAQARVDQLVSERDAARSELASLRGALDDALVANVSLLERVAIAEGLSKMQARASAPARPEVVEVVDPAVLQAASRALGDTAGALRDLAAALDRTSVAVRPQSPDYSSRRSEDPLPGEAAAARPPQRSVPPARPARTKAGPRRVPLAIPGGLVSDSSAAAEHLIRSTNATVVVDGYNVAKLGWPGFSLPDQRDRLLDGLEDLVRRLGSSIVVVFDGADVPGVSTGRRLLRVRFSTAGISADQEIIALVVDSPSDQSMVVVTNDQEIIRGVRTAGANTLTSEQLLAVMRR